MRGIDYHTRRLVVCQFDRNPGVVIVVTGAGLYSFTARYSGEVFHFVGVETLVSPHRLCPHFGVCPCDTTFMDIVDPPQIFEEDVVCVKDHGNQLGVVARLAWALGDRSGDLSASGSDNDSDDDLLPNTVEVAWISDSVATQRSVKPAEEIVVVDRAFLHGDIAARADDPLGQSGTVVGVHLFLDVEFTSSKEKLYCVPAHQVAPIHPYQIGRYVVQGAWLGKIEGCICDVTVQFADGSICVVPRASPTELVPTTLDMMDVQEFLEQEISPYFPSQQVRAVGTVWAAATWEHGQYNNKKHKSGTIIHVQPVMIVVNWTTTAQSGDQITTPAAICAPTSLIVLDHFGHTKWQVGDHVLVPTDARVLYKKPGSLHFAPNTMRCVQHQLNASNTTTGPTGSGSQAAGVTAIHLGGQSGSVTFASGTSYRPASSGLPSMSVFSRSFGLKKSPSGDRNQGPIKPIAKPAKPSGLGWSNSPKPKPLPVTTGVLPPNSPSYDATLMISVDPTKPLPKKEQLQRKKLREKERKKQNQGRNCVKILRTQTLIDILWQDGRVTLRAKAVDFVPCDHLLENDFWPEDFVVSKFEQLNDESSSPNSQRRAGVVRRVDAKNRKSEVRWLDNGKTEEVSSYSISDHTDFEFRLGDIVLRLPAANTELHPSPTSQQQSPPLVATPTVGLIGEILDMYDGRIFVQWSDSSECSVGPEEVFALDSDDEDEAKDESAVAANTTKKGTDMSDAEDGEEGEEDEEEEADEYDEEDAEAEEENDDEEANEEDEDGEEDDEADGEEVEVESRFRVSPNQSPPQSRASSGKLESSGGMQTSASSKHTAKVGPVDDRPPNGNELAESESGTEPNSLNSVAESSILVGTPTQTSALSRTGSYHSSVYASMRRGSFDRSDAVDSKRSEDDSEETSQSMSDSRFETASEKAKAIERIRKRVERFRMVEIDDEDEEGTGSDARSDDETETEDACQSSSRGTSASDATPLGYALRKDSSEKRTFIRTYGGSSGSGAAGGRGFGGEMDTKALRSVLLAHDQGPRVVPLLDDVADTHIRQLSPSSSREQMKEENNVDAGEDEEDDEEGSGGERSASDSVRSVGYLQSPRSQSSNNTTTGAPFPSFSVFLQVIGNHFQGEKHRHLSGASLKGLAKVALREWNLLRNNLPPGIYVHAFEDRVDLFKVLIFGAEGTPYCLSPHEFDILLPPSYPDKPPMLFYNSRVEKLNPNLYEDGKVCLSLLGTWNGRGVEVWDPARSSLLQVVLSIQGLILGTQQPFFLEAGYDKFRGTRQGNYSSQLYNERVLLLSLQLVIKVIRDPPLRFEKLLRWHFKTHRQQFLGLGSLHTALQSLMNASAASAAATVSRPNTEVLAAMPQKDTFTASLFSIPLDPLPSPGFVSVLGQLFPKLKEALSPLE